MDAKRIAIAVVVLVLYYAGGCAMQNRCEDAGGEFQWYTATCFAKGALVKP